MRVKVPKGLRDKLVAARGAAQPGSGALLDVAIAAYDFHVEFHKVRCSPICTALLDLYRFVR